MLTTFIGETLRAVGLAAHEEASNPSLHRQNRRHLDLMATLEGISDPGRPLLDCGCGDGRLLLLLHRAGWQRLYGCDWKLPTNPHADPGCAAIHFKQCDLNGAGLTCYEDHSFATVICSEVLEHVENPAKTLRDISRVMTPDGTLILTLPNACNVFERLYFLVTGESTRYRSERDSGPWSHISFFTGNILQSLLDRADLEVVREGTSAMFWGGYFFFPHRRLSRSWNYSASWVIRKKATGDES